MADQLAELTRKLMIKSKKNLPNNSNIYVPGFDDVKPAVDKKEKRQVLLKTSNIGTPLPKRVTTYVANKSFQSENGNRKSEHLELNSDVRSVALYMNDITSFTIKCDPMDTTTDSYIFTPLFGEGDYWSVYSEAILLGGTYLNHFIAKVEDALFLNDEKKRFYRGMSSTLPDIDYFNNLFANVDLKELDEHDLVPHVINKMYMYISNLFMNKEIMTVLYNQILILLNRARVDNLRCSHHDVTLRAAEHTMKYDPFRNGGAYMLQITCLTFYLMSLLFPFFVLNGRRLASYMYSNFVDLHYGHLVSDSKCYFSDGKVDCVDFEEMVGYSSEVTLDV